MIEELHDTPKNGETKKMCDVNWYQCLLDLKIYIKFIFFPVNSFFFKIIKNKL